LAYLDVQRPLRVPGHADESVLAGEEHDQHAEHDQRCRSPLCASYGAGRAEPHMEEIENSNTGRFQPRAFGLRLDFDYSTGSE
jgi:hypothetical protein